MVKRFEERLLYEDNCKGCMKGKHCHDECEYCCDKKEVLMDVAERVSERDVHIIWDDDNTHSIFEEIQENPAISDSDAYSMAEELNCAYLEDERANLDIPVDGVILCFADLGFWNGRKKACCKIGCNIAEVLKPRLENSLCTWFVENDDLKGKEAHHDATHYYTYRVVSNDDYEAFLCGDFTIDELRTKSKSLADKVKAVYGW